MAKKLIFGNCVLCEFVAKGAGNKHTLVNVYSGDVIVTEFPANLMIALYIEYLRPKNDNSELKLELHIGDELFAEMPVKIKYSPNSKNASIVLPSATLSLNNEVVLTVSATSEGFDRTVVLSKRIYKGVIPQPSLNG